MDLQQFCSTNENHPNIQKPFSRSKWTYATNGHILIRIPRVAGFDEDKGPKEVEALFDEAEARTAVMLWQPLPEFELEYMDCDWCDCKGHVKPCPVFDDPQAKCSNGENKECEKYNEDCTIGCGPSDKGAFVCEVCDGDKRIKLQGKHIVQGALSKVQISAIYLDMIKDLPNVHIAPHDATSAIRIKFDGGEGLLMPVRMD